MLTFTDDVFKQSIQDKTALRPAWDAEPFPDEAADDTQSIARIKASPFIPFTDSVRGFVLDVATGKVNEVVAWRPHRSHTETGGHTVTSTWFDKSTGSSPG